MQTQIRLVLSNFFEVQAMITAVNTAQTSILAQIGNEGDKPDSVNL